MCSSDLSELLFLTDQPYPRISVVFGGSDKDRAPMEIEIEEFVGVKGFKAKGKRITTWHVDHIEELEPTRLPEPEPEPDDDAEQDDEGESVRRYDGRPENVRLAVSLLKLEWVQERVHWNIG